MGMLIFVPYLLAISLLILILRGRVRAEPRLD